MRKVLILGCDGYIGTALTLRLLNKGYHVFGIDNESRRDEVKKLGFESVVEIKSCANKAKIFKQSERFEFKWLDIVQDQEKLDTVIKRFAPDTIVNLAHQPSGPFSQISQDTANFTLMNNYIGTNNVVWSMKRHVPDCHLVQIGTMGEYQHTMGVPIKEGYFEFDGSEECIFPRRTNSIYHASKIASTYLLDTLCRMWDLRCTDIMQGIVFGATTEECNKSGIYSRFDVDECFGTVINRFIAQAILNIPLTVYGQGEHKRTFLSLADSIQALEIAIENPCEKGKPRVWNQLSEQYSMNEIAEIVKKVGDGLNLKVGVCHIDNPRKEQTTEHYYNVVSEILPSLGYKPTRTIEQEIESTMRLLNLDNNKKILSKFKDQLTPKIIF